MNFFQYNNTAAKIPAAAKNTISKPVANFYIDLEKI